MKKHTIFDCLTQLMIIWGVSMLCLCLFCFLFGETAYGYSTIFQLGNRGISVSTALQFFCLAIVITGLKWIFFSDILIKNLSVLFRSVLMFTAIILSVGIFAAAFRWFPVNQAKPWAMFFICFILCSTFSVAVSVKKEKSDNRKIQEALTRFKEENLHFTKTDMYEKPKDIDLAGQKTDLTELKHI